MLGTVKNTTISKTIMIVDDEDYIRELVAIILERAGYNAIKAVNGKDALDKLKTTKIEMVITDLKMPEMDGIEFIRTLCSIDEYKSIPIIILTSESREIKKRECIQAGADEWIMKPFIPRHLLEVVRSLIIKRFLHNN